MSTDPLADLTSEGVSLWLDDLSRDRIQSGNLASLIADRHISGVVQMPFGQRRGEDRRVGGDARDVLLGDQRREVAGLDPVP